MEIRKKGIKKNQNVEISKYDISDLKIGVKVLEDDIKINYKSKSLYGCIREISDKFILLDDHKKVTVHILITSIDDEYLAETEFQIIESNKRNYTVKKISSEIYSDISEQIPCLKM